MLTFNRHAKDFLDAIMGSSLAQSLGRSGVDIQPSWAHGAKILVEGFDSAIFDEIYIEPELGPRHVVVREADQEELLAAFKDLPYRLKPRVKPSAGCVVCPHDGDTSLFAASSDSVSTEDNARLEQDSNTLTYDYGGSTGSGELYIDIIAKRTFINVRQPQHTPRTSISAP